MPGEDHITRMMREAGDLSSEDFVRMVEADRPRDLVSIEDFAAELGKSIRTLRRWNNRPDAPKRFKQGRRLMYSRADVEHWLAGRSH